MNKKSLAFVLPVVAGAFILSTAQASAAVRCETQYGGGETCVRTGELQIDKEVLNPDSGSFVDNLGASDHLFRTAEELTFRLKIKNVGDDTLFDIDVTDTLPSYLFFSGGSASSFNIDSLNPGASYEKEIKATVVSESQLPGDKSLICTVNTAEAEANNGEHDRDTAQFCIGKKSVEKVLGVTTLPKTGANVFFIASIAILISSLTGMALIQIAKH